MEFDEHGIEAAKLWGMRMFIGAWMISTAISAMILLMGGESTSLAFMIAFGALVIVMNYIRRFFKEMKR